MEHEMIRLAISIRKDFICNLKTTILVFLFRTLRILTNTRQLCDQIDMTLVSLASDYLYVLMHIMENGNESK
ncbi:unnamed protein product [Rotaria sp. Silwood2]|nr:unnamed protein product [Rotaria sp. Silwood2]CAF4665084.1 unnamed protein product [Rotaria sp. Silwood2]